MLSCICLIFTYYHPYIRDLISLTSSKNLVEVSQKFLENQRQIKLGNCAVGEKITLSI
jgi:hypothetical protein